MDYDRSREDLLVAGTKRLNTRRSRPSSGPITHKKQRSHSRGNSIASMDEIITPTNATHQQPSPPRSRPTSHHHRRSSVSTRRESSEIMGVHLPEDGLKESSKVDMHLRALLALEGRSSSASTSPSGTSLGFSKVELPDFGADMEKKTDSAGTPKPSFSTNNSLAGKRDSFGKMLAPTSSGPKKELQTLLEEDEGDGDELGNVPASPIVPVPAPRHRPRSLNLRSSIIRAASASASLPTPSTTPASRTPKLKSLTLASSTVISSSSSQHGGSNNGSGNYNPRRSSALVTSTSSPLLSTRELENTRIQRSVSYRRTTSPMITMEPADSLCLPTPTSSYYSSQVLTPGPSPTFERHRRSLSPTEFLAQSHTSLLVARITELEGALTRMTSPSPASTEPSEEFLEMLTDLKAERDQLKKAMEELANRFGEQEKEMASLNRKLDNEKRDAWTSKEKLSRAEKEKEEMKKLNDIANEELTTLRQQLQNLRSQLTMEKEARFQAEKELAAALETPKVPDYPYPTSYTHAQSMDSEMNTSDGACFNIKVRVPSPTQRDDDSDGSFHSRSVSSVSCSSGILSGQPSFVSTPDDVSNRRDSLSSGWSFAKASKKVKQKPSVDHFFACLEDANGGMRVQPMSSPVKSTIGSYNIGFGLSPDEDEDPGFNFGQPALSPFPQSETSDDDYEDGPSNRVSAPFIEEEDSTFSFSAPSDDLSTSPSSPRPSTNDYTAALSPPPSTPPQPSFAEPSTPRPRHKARDSLHLRRNSKLHRISVNSFDIPGPPALANSTPSSPQSPKSPASSESGHVFVPRRASMFPVAPVLDVAIPSDDADDFSSWTLSFDVSSSPPESSSTSLKQQSRPVQPAFLPAQSSSRSIEQKKESSQPLPTPPPSTPSKSPLSNLSFSALAGLLPASWSPRTTPVASPTSSMGRSSFDRACVSREKQLNRLRSEVIEQFGSQSSDGQHGRQWSGSYAI